jgi:hypothetical protein
MILGAVRFCDRNVTDMGLEADARKIQFGALTGFVVGWGIGQYFFVPANVQVLQIVPALAMAGVGVAIGGYIAIHSGGK